MLAYFICMCLVCSDQTNILDVIHTVLCIGEMCPVGSLISHFKGFKGLIFPLICWHIRDRNKVASSIQKENVFKQVVGFVMPQIHLHMTASRAGVSNF